MSNKKVEPTSHFAFSKSLYDECNLKKKEQESTGPFNWITDPIYESPSACFLDESPFMHNNFYSIPSSKVDVESDLRNQTRLLSRCPEARYNPAVNCKSCTKCNSGLPCGCKHCQDTKKQLELHDCNKSGLVPESTRLKRPCDVLSGISINRFEPLYEDLQDTQKIQSNSFIGVNTRMQVKDAYKKQA
jgi:hypothetical protein